MSKELQVANPLIKKYKKYVSNLEWHIKTNKPEGEALRRCEDKLECFKEVLHDLNELPSPSHSAGRWVRASEKDGVQPVRVTSPGSDVIAYAIASVVHGKIIASKFFNGTSLNDIDGEYTVEFLSDESPSPSSKENTQ